MPRRKAATSKSTQGSRRTIILKIVHNRPVVTAPLRTAPLLFFLAASLVAQNTVGGGAPNAPVQTAFQQAFFQNGFNLLVNPVPSINVSPLGSTGYYQEFTSISTSTTKLALILPSIPRCHQRYRRVSDVEPAL